MQEKRSWIFEFSSLQAKTKYRSSFNCFLPSSFDSIPSPVPSWCSRWRLKKIAGWRPTTMAPMAVKVWPLARMKRHRLREPVKATRCGTTCRWNGSALDVSWWTCLTARQGEGQQQRVAELDPIKRKETRSKMEVGGARSGNKYLCVSEFFDRYCIDSAFPT